MKLDCKEGEEKELVATGVQLKRTKSRKTLFSSSGTDKYMFLLVIAMGSSLLHCSIDNFSKVNETRIKVLSSQPSGPLSNRSNRGRDVRGDRFHTLRIPGVSWVEMKIYETITTTTNFIENWKITNYITLH